jgi:hypothetical protein
MRPLRFAVLAVLLFAAAEGMIAAPCTTAALSVYDAVSFTCTLGPFTVTNVTYAYVSGTVIPDTAITVTPLTNPLSFGLKFSSSAWTVSGSASSDYNLTYTWDPGTIRSLDDFLDDPVTPPGLASITTSVCPNANFSAGCLGETSITVFDDGISPSKSASDPFIPPLNTVGVQNTILIEGGGAGGNATFTDFGNVVDIPEPNSIFGGLFGLGLTLALKLRRKRR